MGRITSYHLAADSLPIVSQVAPGPNERIYSLAKSFVDLAAKERRQERYVIEDCDGVSRPYTAEEILSLAYLFPEERH